MKNVLIPTKLDACAKEALQANGYSVTQDADTPLAELVKTQPGTQALIVRSEKVTADIINALPDLKLIVRAGAGYNTIDTKYARKRGVDVMNTPGANANAVAEEVIALALAYLRYVVPGDISTRKGEWKKKEFLGRELAQKTVGIVGLGNIGQLVGQRLEGFECTLLAYDPVINEARAAEVGAKLVSIEELFAQSDIVTLHVPENDDTRGMVSTKLLGLLKPGAVLVNCARAGIIDEAALRAAKQEKEIGFCNDVYAADEPGEKSVADIADVMLPHLGANTREANRNAARRAAEQLMAYATRGVTKYVVNKGVPEGLDERYQELAYQTGLFARHFLGVDRCLSRLECSFYGDLNQYAEWLVPPIVAAITSEVDASIDLAEATACLKDKGVGVEIRETDPTKHFGESLTVDLSEGGEKIQRVSVRGTIAEGNLMISRINDYDKLYFQPVGNSLIVVYQDRPGVLAKITGACADADINIEEIRSPRGRSGARAIAVLKTNVLVPRETVDRIREETEAEVAFSVAIPASS